LTHRAPWTPIQPTPHTTHSRTRPPAVEHRAHATLGFTHYQAAQLTTVGKRMTLYMQDFLMDLNNLEREIETIPMRGLKGTTGTQVRPLLSVLSALLFFVWLSGPCRALYRNANPSTHPFHSLTQSPPLIIPTTTTVPVITNTDTATQATFLELFEGDHAKVKECNRRVCELMGFSKWVAVSGQTYTRKIDYQILS
jgi:adenylosuccinate lyase